MFIIKRTPEFDVWFSGLRDRTTCIRLAARLDKAQRGILGDVKPVGDGVFEMREFFGPGWRMYYVQHGAVLIVMLGGGDKSSQARDVAAAQKQAANLDFKDVTQE
jgi:putative addiction module killer protein